MGEKFFFNNKKEASDLKEFLAVLKTLSKDDFDHHVNKQRNDFANWIEYSLQKKDLAKSIANLSTKAAIANKIKEHLSNKTAKKVKPKKVSIKKTVSTKKKSTPTKKSVKDVKPSYKKEVKKEKVVLPKKSVERKIVVPKQKVSYISTDSPSDFILKEFLMGALFGLLLGFILMAMLYRSGALF